MKRVFRFFSLLICGFLVFTTGLSCIKPLNTEAATLKKPGRPVISLKASKKAGRIKVTINQTQRATGYRIYIREKGQDSFKKVKSLKKDGTEVRSYTIKKLTPGKTYYVKVVAVNKVDKKVKLSKYSKTKKIKLKKASLSTEYDGTVTKTPAATPEPTPVVTKAPEKSGKKVSWNGKKYDKIDFTNGTNSNWPKGIENHYKSGEIPGFEGNDQLWAETVAANLINELETKLKNDYPAFELGDSKVYFNWIDDEGGVVYWFEYSIKLKKGNNSKYVFKQLSNISSSLAVKSLWDYPGSRLTRINTKTGEEYLLNNDYGGSTGMTVFCLMEFYRLKDIIPEADELVKEYFA